MMCNTTPPLFKKSCLKEISSQRYLAEQLGEVPQKIIDGWETLTKDNRMLTAQAITISYLHPSALPGSRQQFASVWSS